MKKLIQLAVITLCFAATSYAMSWKEHYDLGCQFFESGNTDLAWQHLWDALSRAKKEKDNKKIAKSSTLLGDLQLKAKLPGKAYQFYSQARKAWEKELDIRKIFDTWRAPKKSWLGLKLKHNEVSDWIMYEYVLSKLSDIALNLNKKHLAIRLSTRFMQIKEIRLGKNSQEYGWALSRYAKVLFRCDKLTEAEAAYNETLSIVSNRAHSSQTAALQKELALVLQAMGKELEADLLRKKAKENLSFERVWGYEKKQAYELEPPKGIKLNRPLSPLIYCEFPQETTTGALAFSPDGSTLATYSGGSKGGIHFWSISTKKWLGGLVLANDSVSSLEYSSNGQQIFAATTKGVRRWNIRNKKELSPIKTAVGNNFVFSMALSRTGKYLVFCTSTEVGSVPVSYLCATKDGSIVKELLGHKSSVTAIVCSSNEDVLATGGSDGKIMIWDIESKKHLSTITQSDGTITALCFSNDLLCSTSDKGTIECWNWRTGQLVNSLPATGTKLQTLAAFPTSGLLLSGGYDTLVRLWDPLSKKVKRSYRDHGGIIWHLAVSPTERHFASFGMDSRVLIWKLKP